MFPEGRFRGVYILSQGKPEHSPTNSPENIIYIGETHGRTSKLRKRLGKFYKSGNTGVLGHAGGVTYFGHGFDPGFEDVFFSVMPCNRSEQVLNTALIYHVEREMIWNMPTSMVACRHVTQSRTWRSVC